MPNTEAIKNLPIVQIIFGCYCVFAHLLALYLSNNAFEWKWRSYSHTQYVHYAPTAALNLSVGFICGLNLVISGEINRKFDSTSRKSIKRTVLSNIFSIVLSIGMLCLSIMVYEREERVFKFLILFITIYVAVIIGMIIQIAFLIVSIKKIFSRQVFSPTFIASICFAGDALVAN